MEKKVAVPMENGMLCAHFGHCEKFYIATLEDAKIKNEIEITPPEHQPGLYPKWIKAQGVSCVIAGGMGEKAITLFNEQNINVFVGAPIKQASELVADFIASKLSLDANYCDHENHQHRHGNCGDS